MVLALKFWIILVMFDDGNQNKKQENVKSKSSTLTFEMSVVYTIDISNVKFDTWVRARQLFCFYV